MAVTGPLTTYEQLSHRPASQRTFLHPLRTSREQNHAPFNGATSLLLQLNNLPPGITTLEIHQNMQKYGKLTRIEIYDRRDESRGARAEIRFEPPPDIDMKNPYINIVCEAGEFRIKLTVASHQPRSPFVDSPANPGLKYRVKTELLGSRIQFGVLTQPTTMMTMTSRNNEHERIQMTLNLHHKEIEVIFPTRITSPNRSANRLFRFQVALDDDFSVWQLPHHEYVLALKAPPRYSKQLEEAIKFTHDPHSKRWSEADTWARQTDIVNQKMDIQKINRLPLSLRKELNTINIARWTVFKINLIDTPQNHTTEKVFISALKDFNVRVMDGSGFKITRPRPDLEREIWTLMGDGQVHARPRSNAEVMSDVALPFSVQYQLWVCISKGWINEYTLTVDFLLELSRLTEQRARQLLIYVDSYRERVWEPMSIFTNLKYHSPVKQQVLPAQCMEIQSATVTASGLMVNTPNVESTNRIIRQYKNLSSHFLRVRFVDDSHRGQSKIFSQSNNKMVQIFGRVRRTLKSGIKIGDRHFEFLAWGNSQLREHSAYFFASTGETSAATIRRDMGMFDNEKVVAKRAARMGQCFSTTRPIQLRIDPKSTVHLVEDIKSADKKWTFTDGVGMISKLASNIICQQLKLKDSPSAFQFRLGGCKGVLVQWPELKGTEIKLRASQFKFMSPANDLEIIRWSEFWQPFLNRQIIICLSDLGVPDAIFLEKQRATITSLNQAMGDDSVALKTLRENVDPNRMTLSMCDLVTAGFRSTGEPFVDALMRLWRASTLKYLKEKAKIPVAKGAFVLGIADETGELKGHQESCIGSNDPSQLPQIFLQVTNQQTGRREVITGICILARNPSLHRGDIRVAMAVDLPSLRSLCDVVVMPITGSRDLPSMCSGGDLDGDDYIVIWDHDLIPQVWNDEPFGYEAPEPRMAEHDITVDHIIDFFCDYMQNDCLGRIAHAHLGAADYYDEGIQSDVCKKLVQLHSMAVDYPKTGVPAAMTRDVERNRWPHFMKKKSAWYTSHKVLGKLYDAVKEVSFQPHYTAAFDRRILDAHQPSLALTRSIMHLKQDYDNALQRIMAQHDIRTEFEIWSTFVMDHSKASSDYKFHEEIGNLSRTLKASYYDQLCDVAGGRDFEQLAPVAVAAYRYTFNEVQYGLERREKDDRPEGMPFISFPWVLQDTLCEIAQQADVYHNAPLKATSQGGDEAIRARIGGMLQVSATDTQGAGFEPEQSLTLQEIGNSQIMSDVVHASQVVQDTTTISNSPQVRAAKDRMDSGLPSIAEREVASQELEISQSPATRPAKGLTSAEHQLSVAPEGIDRNLVALTSQDSDKHDYDHGSPSFNSESRPSLAWSKARIISSPEICDRDNDLQRTCVQSPHRQQDPSSKRTPGRREIQDRGPVTREDMLTVSEIGVDDNVTTATVTFPPNPTIRMAPKIFGDPANMTVEDLTALGLADIELTD